MSERDHFFLKVELERIDALNYVTTIRQFHKPIGLVIHCLFWLHQPIKSGDEGDRHWTCRDCLLKAYEKVK